MMAGFVEVRSAAGKLLFEIDPARQLIRIKPKGGDVELIDLREYGQGTLTRLIQRPEDGGAAAETS
jgi:hypothetical protein